MCDTTLSSSQEITASQDFFQAMVASSSTNKKMALFQLPVLAKKCDIALMVRMNRYSYILISIVQY